MTDYLTGQDTYGDMNYGVPSPPPSGLTPEQQLGNLAKSLGAGSVAAPGGTGPGGTYSLPDLGSFYREMAKSAPPGSYNPDLDYSLIEARVGLAQKLQDLATQQQRRQDAYNIYTIPGLQHQYATQLADVTQQHNYATQDIGTQRAAAKTNLGRRLADYQTQIGNTQRQFANLGNQQAQSAEAMGSGDGGTLAQALVNRGVNEQQALNPLQTGMTRANEDYQTQLGALDRQQQRADTAFNTYAGPNSGNPMDPTGRLAWALAQGVGQASTRYGQEGQDAALQAQRSVDEMNRYLLGVGATAQNQAAAYQRDPGNASTMTDLNAPSYAGG